MVPGDAEHAVPAYVSGLSRVRKHGAENGVRDARVWRGLLRVERTVIEEIDFDEDASHVAQAP